METQNTDISGSLVQVGFNELVRILQETPPGGAVMIHGYAGGAKTAGVREAYNDGKTQIFYQPMATTPPENLEGVPFLHTEDGVHTTLFAVPYHLRDLCNPKYENTRQVLFLDELTSASKHAAQIAMQIALEKRIGSIQMNKNVIVIGAGNLVKENTGAIRMAPAIANRFTHFELKMGIEEWITGWAYPHDCDPTLIAYFRKQPEHIMNFDPKSPSFAFATYRSVERADQWVKKLGWTETGIKAMQGCIGEGLGMQIKAFHDMQHNLPEISDIVANPDTIDISNKPDVCHFVATMLTAHLMKSTDYKTWESCLVYLLRMEVEYSSNAVRDLVLCSLSHVTPLLAEVCEKDSRIQKGYAEKWDKVFKKFNNNQ
jgi:hypothetical protein